VSPAAWDEYIRRCDNADAVYRAEWAEAQRMPTFGQARDATLAADRKRTAAWQAAADVAEAEGAAVAAGAL